MKKQKNQEIVVKMMKMLKNKMKMVKSKEITLDVIKMNQERHLST